MVFFGKLLVLSCVSQKNDAGEHVILYKTSTFPFKGLQEWSKDSFKKLANPLVCYRWEFPTVKKWHESCSHPSCRKACYSCSDVEHGQRLMKNPDFLGLPSDCLTWTRWVHEMRKLHMHPCTYSYRNKQNNDAYLLKTFVVHLPTQKPSWPWFQSSA